jgi:hypothetical protein
MTDELPEGLARTPNILHSEPKLQRLRRERDYWTAG